MVLEGAAVDYYAKREQKERQMAARTTDPQVARIHRELADRYADCIRSRQSPTLQFAVRR